MKIGTKRAFMLWALLIGVAWDLLCLFHVMPLSYCSVSLALVGGGAAVLLFVPLLFPALSKADEKSRHYSELTRKEKRASGLMIGLIAGWLVTWIACIARPL